MKLGVPRAHEAKICLDCHSDNVPEASRGKDFRLEDGIGCEACHGGAGDWYESHKTGPPHEQNIARGLYPTDDPFARARLCQSCHLGTRVSFATHRILGAGHPRLRFQLEAYSYGEIHHEEDADYEDRKRVFDPANVWLVGLATMGMQTVELLGGKRFAGDALLPELAFYQCDGCHHRLHDADTCRQPGADSRWCASLGEPWTMRLNDAALTVLATALELVSPRQAVGLRTGIDELHRASMGSRYALGEAAETLRVRLGALTERLAHANYSTNQLRNLRAKLLQDAADGRIRYHAEAEQIYFAVETLWSRIDDGFDQNRLDRWFNSIEDRGAFETAEYKSRAKEIAEALQQKPGL